MPMSAVMELIGKTLPEGPRLVRISLMSIIAAPKMDVKGIK